MIKFLQRHRGTQGSVTIMMVVIMLPMLVFSFSIVDICKIFMAKDVVTDAANLSLNAGMTSYDKVLKDMYGILATSKTEEQLAEQMSKYYAATLAANGISDDEVDLEHILTSLLGNIDDINTDVFAQDNSYLKVNPEKINGADNYVSVNAFDSSAASNPAVLERQIVEYMKYRGPLNMAEGMLDKINVLKDLPNQSKVTEARMEFEDKLNDINNDMIDIYTLFQLYFYNNIRVEDGNTNFKIIHESEKQDLIKKYKCGGNVHKSAEMIKNSKDFKRIECKLKRASMLLYFYAPFCDYLKTERNSLEMNSLGSASGDASQIAKDLINSCNALKLSTIDSGNLDFEGMMDALNNGEEYIKTFCLMSGYDDAKGWNAAQVDEDDVENAYNVIITVQAFCKLYRNGKGGTQTTDVSDRAKEFLKYYKVVTAKAESITIKPEDYEILTEALYQVQSTYDTLQSGLDDMESLVLWASEEANKEFNDAYSRMKEIYLFVDSQLRIIEELSGDDSDLDTLVEDMIDAKNYANDEYQPAINNVQSDNQKNSAQQTFDHEAKIVSEISQEDANKLKDELKSHKKYYEMVKEALLDMRLLPELQSPLEIVNKETFKKKHERIEGICGNMLANNSPSNVQGFYTVYRKLDDYINKNNSLNLSAWTVNNSDAIKKNPLYQQIEKLCTPKEEKNDDNKNAIMTNANTKAKTSADSDKDLSLPGGVELEGNNNKSSEEDQKAFKAMQEAEKFSAYIAKSDEAKSVISQTSKLNDEQMQVNANLNTSGSDSDTKANALDMIKAMNTIMEKLGEIMTDGRDALLVTEYLTGNFSCHTTSMDGTGKRKNDAKMLSGQLFYLKMGDKVVKNVGYGSELEYILYGCKTELGNKAAAGGSIFALRFVLNLIYSFTDAEIRAFTFSVASAAVGWLPFAVPLVQTVLHIGLSLAESTIDLTYLMRGAAVPLYKSPTTWYCKGTNAIRHTAGTVVQHLSKKTIDTASDKLCTLIQNKSKDAKEWVNAKSEYIQAQIDEIRQQIQNTVMSPVYEVIQDCMQRYDDLKNEPPEKAKAEIERQLNQALDTLEQSLINQATLNVDGQTNLVNEVTLEIVRALKPQVSTIANNIWNSLKSLILNAKIELNANAEEPPSFGAFSKFVDDKMQTVFNTINDYIGKANQTLDNMSDKAKKFVSNMEDKISTAIDDVANELKNGVEYGADQLKDAINTRVSGAVTGHKNSTIIGSKNKSATSVEHILDMTYQDYLYVFTLIGVFANRDAMLERAALLMQANCVVHSNGKLQDYTLNEARTFFSVDVRASTSTTFYGSVFKDGKLDMSGTRKKYEFTESVYMGY